MEVPMKYQDWSDTEDHPFWETLLLQMLNIGWVATEADETWELAEDEV